METGRVVPRKRDNSRARKKSGYFWRDSENRYIATHRMDGYLLIAESMKGRGFDRSPEAIKKHAARKLGIRLAKYPEGGMRKCVACGAWDARPNSHSGRAGFCPACWERRKAEAMREGRSERQAAAEYQKEKKRKRDEREREKRKERQHGSDKGNG